MYVAQFDSYLGSGKLIDVLRDLRIFWPEVREFSDLLMGWFDHKPMYSGNWYRCMRWNYYNVRYEQELDCKRPYNMLSQLRDRVQQQISSSISHVRKVPSEPLLSIKSDDLLSRLVELSEFLSLEFTDLLNSNHALGNECRLAIDELGFFFAKMQEESISLKNEVATLMDMGKSGELSRANQDRVSKILTIFRENLTKTRSCSSVLAKLQNLCEGRTSFCVPTHDDMHRHFMDCSDIFRKLVKTSYENHEELKSINASDRDAFFKRVQFAMSFLIQMDADDARSRSRPNSHEREMDCLAHINREITKMEEAAERDEIWFDALRAMEECLEDQNIKTRLQQIRSTIAREKKDRWETLIDACLLSEEE